MRDWIREHRGAILASLVATAIFIYLLEPILGVVITVTVKVARFLGTKYVDRIYT